MSKDGAIVDYPSYIIYASRECHAPEGVEMVLEHQPNT